MKIITINGKIFRKNLDRLNLAWSDQNYTCLKYVLFRFPALNSPLEVEAAVNRIMRGILTNEHVICLPRTVYFFNVMRT